MLTIQGEKLLLVELIWSNERKQSSKLFFTMSGLIGLWFSSISDVGHLAFLTETKKRGDYLIVGLHSDKASTSAEIEHLFKYAL